jgi:hypothetical protein
MVLICTAGYLIGSVAFDDTEGHRVAPCVAEHRARHQQPYPGAAAILAAAQLPVPDHVKAAPSGLEEFAALLDREAETTTQLDPNTLQWAADMARHLSRQEPIT